MRISKKKSDVMNGYINIKGAVIEEGKYKLLKGDTLFSLIKRSGGLKKDAYIFGLVLTREQEKKRARGI